MTVEELNRKMTAMSRPKKKIHIVRVHKIKVNRRSIKSYLRSRAKIVNAVIKIRSCNPQYR